jgi:hypothetical protein
MNESHFERVPLNISWIVDSVCRKILSLCSRLLVIDGYNLHIRDSAFFVPTKNIKTDVFIIEDSQTSTTDSSLMLYISPSVYRYGVFKACMFECTFILFLFFLAASRREAMNCFKLFVH